MPLTVPVSFLSEFANAIRERPYSNGSCVRKMQKGLSIFREIKKAVSFGRLWGYVTGGGEVT